MKRKKKDDNVPQREMVVKCTLKKYVITSTILPVIDQWVQHVSYLSYRGSLILNHFLIYCLEHNLPIPDVHDQNLYYHCFVIGNAQLKKPTPGLQEFYENHKHMYPESVQRIEGDTQALMYSCHQLMTNTKNTLFMTFENKQKRHVKAWCVENKIDLAAVWPIRCAINRWKCKTSIEATDCMDKIDAFIKEQQNLLPNPGKSGIQQSWLKTKENAAYVLRYYYEMLRWFEDRGQKGFTLASIVSIRSRFMTIDTKVLYFMAKQAGLIDKQSLESMYENASELFASIFKVKKVASGKKEFTNLVQTDGTSLCIHMREAIDTQNDTPVPDKKNERVIAVDPGRSNMIFAVEQNEHTKFVYKLTRRQYYNESHITRNKHKLKNFGRSGLAPIFLTELCEGSLKTFRLSKFEAYLSTLKRWNDALWEHYTKRKFALLRLDTYIHKRRCLDLFFNLMKVDENGKTLPKPVIAYGAADFDPTGPFERSVPTTALSQACKRHFKVEMVDEFNTTKCCRNCGEMLHSVKRDRIIIKDGEEKIVRADVRGLKNCCSSLCFKTRLVSRDMNAALNILDCFVLPSRPSYLCRNPSKDILPVKRQVTTGIQ